MEKKSPAREDSRSPSPERPRVFKPIAATKLHAFTVGSHRKTPYQKHKEELESKKKRESEEAAQVYAEFVASFEGATDYKLGTSTFVKSHTLPGRGVTTAAKDAKTDTKADTKTDTKPVTKVDTKPGFSQTSTEKPKYTPKPFVKAGEIPKSRSAPKPMPKSLKEIEPDDDEEDNDLLAFKEAQAQKKRNLDTFLEEIKKGQEDREDRLRAKFGKVSAPAEREKSPDASGLTLKAAFEDRPGSYDTGDPMTTNLYVGNINPSVNEMTLCQEFAKYGPIASVKIMWPRTQEERDRNRNCGFVSFMRREDAEQALKHLDSKEFHDYVMKVGWGKTVPLPAKPVFVLDKNTRAAQTGLPFNAQIVHPPGGVNSKPRAQVTVVKPTNMQQVKIIHRMVERVAKYGSAFEARIMEREHDNPKFKFLFDNMSDEHIYYRWRLYSILQGDTKEQWRTEPFQMFEGGAWWIPPDVPFVDEGMDNILLDSEDEEREQKRENIPKGTLGKIARQRFEIMLRQVTFKRGEIARAMAFAIDHADAADEVTEILIKSLLLPETPIPTKLARLFLVSDILHNSSVHVPNAWKYRKELEGRLPSVFEHFNDIYRGITARLKAEQVRRHVSSVLSVWENWMVFPQHYIQLLGDILTRKPPSQNPEQGESASSEIAKQDSKNAETDGGAMEVDDDAVDGIPMEEDNDVDGAPLDDVDGEPLDDVDGAPLDDVDGEPLDDVDGEPLDDVDGEPLDEDLDGEPFESTSGEQTK